MEISHKFDLTCPLCNQPVSLETDTCADENGKAVHQNCYAQHVIQREPTEPVS